MNDDIIRLSEYPWVVVRIECKFCPRRGRSRLARLADQHGAEIEMERLLELVAANCKWMRPRERVRMYETRWGIRLPDLDLQRPPPDLPPAITTTR